MGPPMAGGQRHLFVYWHAVPADVPAALQTLREAHGTLRAQHPRLHCTAYLRNEPGAAQATLMESYAMDAGQASATLDEALQQGIDATVAAAVARWQRGERHRELFDAVDG